MLNAQRRVLFHARQPQPEAGDTAWPLQLTLRAEEPFIAYLTVIRQASPLRDRTQPGLQILEACWCILAPLAMNVHSRR